MNENDFVVGAWEVQPDGSLRLVTEDGYIAMCEEPAHEEDKGEWDVTVAYPGAFRRTSPRNMAGDEVLWLNGEDNIPLSSEEAQSLAMTVINADRQKQAAKDVAKREDR